MGWANVLWAVDLAVLWIWFGRDQIEYNFGKTGISSWKGKQLSRDRLCVC